MLLLTKQSKSLVSLISSILYPIKKISSFNRKIKILFSLLDKIEISETEFGTVVKVNNSLVLDSDGLILKSQKDIIIQSNVNDNYKLHLNPVYTEKTKPQKPQINPLKPYKYVELCKDEEV